MTPELITILMFAGVLIGVFLGFPIAFTLGGLGLLFGFIGWGPQVIPLMGSKMFSIANNYTYVAIPLFVFMGCMLERSGIADIAFGVLNQWLRKFRGGLALATILICTLFAACTGVVGASVTTMGLLALPAMISRGYNKSLATGVVAAGGTLGILIPPSIMLILYGPLAKVSVVKLFSAAFTPGLLLAGLYFAYVVIASRVIKDLVPAHDQSNEKNTYTLAQGLKAFLPFILLILTVLGAIFFGIAAPTEAAAVGAFGSVLIAAGYKRCTKKALYESAITTLKVSSMVMFVALGANIFTAVFFGVGGGTVVAGFIESLGLGAYGTLFFVLFLVLLLGMLIDWVGILLIVVPIFIPILESFGFNQLWVGMLIIVIMQSSFLTPPFAFALFYIKGIAPKGVAIGDIYRGVVPFILIQVFALILCIIFPDIILWLPDFLEATGK